MSKVTSLVDCSDAEAVECLNDFCESVQQEMSVNGAIPFSIPVEAIAQLTKNARETFYRMYSDASEEMFIAIPYEEIYKKQFRHGIAQMEKEGDKKVTRDRRGAYMLPEGVISVVGCYDRQWSGEAGWNTGLLGKNAGDVSLQRMLYASVYDRTLCISADNTMFYICTESFLDLSRQLFDHMISFNYNRLTNNIRFIGELPKGDVVLDVLVKIPDCDLYNDSLFRRYVIAECKIQLGRILGAFAFQLPGNISVNTEAIANEGSTERDAILQELRDMSSSWYMMTT